MSNELKLPSGTDIKKYEFIVNICNVMVGDENDTAESIPSLIEDKERNEDVI